MHDVELALWAHHNAKKLNPKLLEKPISFRNKKRTSMAVDKNESSSSEEDAGTKPKKLKSS